MQTEDGSFLCRVCGKTFPLQRLLNRHIKCHSDIKRYLCTFCGKGFNDTFDLKRHTRTHTGKFKSKIHTFFFSTSKILAEHLCFIYVFLSSLFCILGVRPYKCTHCDKAFTQRCSLESHGKKVHGLSFNYAYKQRRTKMYVCEECGHTVNDPEEHYVHLRDNHPHSPALLKCYDKRQFKFSNDKVPQSIATTVQTKA